MLLGRLYVVGLWGGKRRISLEGENKNVPMDNWGGPGMLPFYGLGTARRQGDPTGPSVHLDSGKIPIV